MIPTDTAQAVLDAFDGNNLYIKIGDSLDSILEDLPGNPLECPVQQIPIPAYVFALVTIFQYQEKLTDEEMAESLRKRPELRYGLRLSLRRPNISSFALCQYRQELFSNSDLFQSFCQIADHVVGVTHKEGKLEILEGTIPDSICRTNRVNRLINVMLETLGSLAATQTEWMREVVPAYWYDRYNRSSSRFVRASLQATSMSNILEIGNDILYMLGSAKQSPTITTLPEIRMLTQVFNENYEVSNEDTGLRWRPVSCSYCARAIATMREVK